MRRLADGSLLAGAVLRSGARGLRHRAHRPVARRQRSPAPTLLGEHRVGAAAPTSAAISNKPSNNFVAEAIYKTLGGELLRPAGQRSPRARARSWSYLTAAGIKPSALQDRQRLGAHAREPHHRRRDLSSLLRTIYYDLSVAPEFLSSLAIGGIDGTISNRFQGTDAVGLVRAKTGTLNGVSALSGYVGDKGDVLIFSIFVEGFRHSAPTRSATRRCAWCRRCCRYLRTRCNEPGRRRRRHGDPGRGADGLRVRRRSGRRRRPRPAPTSPNSAAPTLSNRPAPSLPTRAIVSSPSPCSTARRQRYVQSSNSPRLRSRHQRAEDAARARGLQAARQSTAADQALVEQTHPIVAGERRRLDAVERHRHRRRRQLVREALRVGHRARRTERCAPARAAIPRRRAARART